MAEFIRMVNKTKGQNIMFLKSSDKSSKLYSEKDLLIKKFDNNKLDSNCKNKS